MSGHLEIAIEHGTEVMDAAAAEEWLADITGSNSGTGFWPAPWVRREVERITGIPLDEHYIGADRVSKLRVIAQRVRAALARGADRYATLCAEPEDGQHEDQMRAEVPDA